MLEDITVILVSLVLGIICFSAGYGFLAFLSWMITWVGIVWMILVWRRK